MIDQRAAQEGPLARTPSGVLVLGAITSVQLGAAIATTLFAEIGPAGTVFERLAFGSLVLVAIWRPHVRGRSRGELVQAGVFGLVLAAMNLSFYESLDRIPLGIAVALEFVGPLTVALLGSRRLLDLLWVALPRRGILDSHPSRGELTRSAGHRPGSAGGSLLGCLHPPQCTAGPGVPGGHGPDAGDVRGGGGCRAARHRRRRRPFPLGRSPGARPAVGVLSSVIPYSFEIEALRRIAPPVFGVLMSLEPAVAAIAGFLVVGQPISCATARWNRPRHIRIRRGQPLERGGARGGVVRVGAQAGSGSNRSNNA